MKEKLILEETNFRATREHMGYALFGKVAAGSNCLDDLIQNLRRACRIQGYDTWLEELIQMDAHVFDLQIREVPTHPREGLPMVNPGLKFFSNTWQNLASVLGPSLYQDQPDRCGKDSDDRPVRGPEQVMVWPDPSLEVVRARAVTQEDLLVLKMGMERVSAWQVARETGASVVDINSALVRALNQGIVLGPEPGICREAHGTAGSESLSRGQFQRSRVFALQWHITQACDLHCRHCYDRTPCDPLPLSKEIAILDSLEQFCRTHHLFGQVSFSGGNPLLHPRFHRLYQEASDRGFFVGILGNPASKEEIQSLIALGPLSFYQVSLEGLEPHNDYIRGKGHFRRTVEFLKVLKECRVYAKVMLTLTRDNQDQVISLGRYLKGRTDLFTFNRLSLAGEGASLAVADTRGYRKFLETYLAETQVNPILGLKDNLFNILLAQTEQPLFGGCTGYGCGAAFNFVSVLATGKVHACRKFHSPIGDLTGQSLTDIYHSKAAARYRQGPSECSTCSINRVCRGCLASAHSFGMNRFEQKDPYCFI